MTDCVARVTTLEDAHFIVEAVNNYETLLARTATLKSVNKDQRQVIAELVETLESIHSWEHPLVMPKCKACAILSRAKEGAK